MKTFLACGHAANATTQRDGANVPCCAICAPSPESVTVVEAPSLEGRVARCGDCRKEVPSSFGLAFFEYGSVDYPADLQSRWQAAYEACMKAGGRGRAPKKLEDAVCEARDAMSGKGAKDRYYCGCRGWD